MQGFSVLNHKVEGNDRIEVGFSFKATGLDKNEKQTGETLEGSATAWIDEFNNVEFSDVEAELTNPNCQQIVEELFFPDPEEESTIDFIRNKDSCPTAAGKTGEKLRLLGHLHRSRRALERRDHARKGVGSNGGTP